MTLAPDRQPLNPMDIALRCIDLEIRTMGYPGFETQMLVWLRGRADVERLQAALARLGRRHPVVTARLVDGAKGQPFYWRFRPAAAPELDLVHVLADDDDAVLAAASVLISTPRDPAAFDPMRFHLLRRPGSGDVFVIQYNHALMDNSATALVLREINELSQTAGSAAEDHPRYEPRFLIGRYLSRLSHAERRAATAAALELQAYTLRGRAALLSTGEEDRPRRPALRIAGRQLPADETARLRARLIQVCGLPSLSMGILGSALRSIQQLGDAQRNVGRRYIAGIGLDLKLRAGSGALFQNLLSLVTVAAQPEELSDRDGLVRALSLQMRDRLVSRHDVGIVRLAHTFQRRPRYVSWALAHCLRYYCSLWYAYFGPVDAGSERFCGVEVDRVHYVGPTWSPKGIALLANQFDGRLLLQITHDPELVAPPLAEAFLDWLLADLREFAAATAPRRP